MGVSNTAQYRHAKSKKAISVISSPPCKILLFPIMNTSQVNFFIFYAAATVRDLFRQCHELLVLMFMNNLLVADAEAFPKLLEFIIEIHVQTNLVLHLDACLDHLAF